MERGLRDGAAGSSLKLWRRDGDGAKEQQDSRQLFAGPGALGISEGSEGQVLEGSGRGGTAVDPWKGAWTGHSTGGTGWRLLKVMLRRSPAA